MRKTGLKIGLFAVLSVVGLIVGFFFSGYLNLLLSGQRVDDVSTLEPAKIVASLETDGRHRQLALCIGLVAVAGAGALTLMNRRETFESDTSPVAGAIITPVAVGQGQHGTARWLKKSERPKAFNIYRLDKSDQVFAALIEAGERDLKEVDNRKEISNPDDKNRNKESQGAGAPDPAAQTSATEPDKKSE